MDGDHLLGPAIFCSTTATVPARTTKKSKFSSPVR